MIDRRKSTFYKYGENKWISNIFLAALILLVISTLAGLYRIQGMTVEIDHMQKDIELLNQQVQSGTSNLEQTEYLKTIEYLENETSKYRSFVEQQQDFLIRLIVFLGTGVTAVAAFFGIRTRKDVAQLVHDECKGSINGEIAKFVGGEDKVRYLVECIEKEERAKSKKILFIMQEEQDKNLKKIYDSLCDQGYCAEKRKVEGLVSEQRISNIVDGYDVVIYQMDKSEFHDEHSENRDTNYIRISKECNTKKIQGIIYCTSSNGINRKECKPSFYISTANYSSTVLERIHSILYFIEE